MLLPNSQNSLSLHDRTVYVAGFGTQGSVAGLTALEELRIFGISAVSDFRSTTLKAHLRQADRLGCHFTLMLGDDEAAKGVAVLRNMESKNQYEVLLSSLCSQIQTLLLPS